MCSYVMESGRGVDGACVGVVPSNHCISVANLSLWSILHCMYDIMLRCWQEEPMERPSFSQLRTSFSAMLQAGSVHEYIDLQVNEEAPCYKDDGQMKRSNSTSSASSDDSVSISDKQKEPQEKEVTISCDSTPEQGWQGQQQGEGDEEETPVQLGIPISQLVPASSSSQNMERQLTPVDEATPQDHTPLECRTTHSNEHEPSKAVDESITTTSVPVTVTSDGAHSEGVRESSLNPSELVESTHL